MCKRRVWDTPHTSHPDRCECAQRRAYKIRFVSLCLSRMKRENVYSYIYGWLCVCVCVSGYSMRKMYKLVTGNITLFRHIRGCKRRITNKGSEAPSATTFCLTLRHFIILLWSWSRTTGRSVPHHRQPHTAMRGSVHFSCLIWSSSTPRT